MVCFLWGHHWFEAFWKTSFPFGYLFSFCYFLNYMPFWNGNYTYFFLESFFPFVNFFLLSLEVSFSLYISPWTECCDVHFLFCFICEVWTELTDVCNFESLLWPFALSSSVISHLSDLSTELLFDVKFTLFFPHFW